MKLRRSRPGESSASASLSAPTVEAAEAVADELCGALGAARESLMPLLQAVQQRYGYLPRSVLEAVAARGGASAAEVEGVATSYPLFRLAPAGRHTIRVCVGTACHVKGADRVIEALRRHLGIPESSDTDSQGLFTVSSVACLGCCMLAPVLQIGPIIYGQVDPARVGELVEKFLDEAEAGDGAAPRPAAPPRLTGGQPELALCTCSSCAAAGARVLRRELEKSMRRRGVRATVREVACTGASSLAPLLTLREPGKQAVWYPRVGPDDADEIVSLLPRASRGGAARLSAEKLLRLAMAGSPRGQIRHETAGSLGLEALGWGRQVHLVTEGSGELDPLDLDAYAAAGGLQALHRLRKAGGAPWVARSGEAGASPESGLDAESVIREIQASGLRGRGGAGYPTGRKWAAVSRRKAARRYVICNGDEGDPGAFMDRLLLESFPFRVIEGVVIACFAVDASEAILYIREEYPEAKARVGRALEIWRDRGLLPEGLSLRVFGAPGAFVCGEETALIASVQGERGTPRLRPPYPEESGLLGMPTLVNNVETFAAIPWILRHGAEAFRAIGTPDSPGTKTFALAGKVRRGGLIEVPMGMSVREIVEETGGGTENGGAWKAVQIGGPSGGCVPAELGHTRVDYEALVAAGAFMGSGGLVVLDSHDCMVDIARYFMSFTRRESCGKCAPCRIGTARLLELLERLCEGRAHAADLAELEELAHRVTETSLCNLGRSAPNPVLSTLSFFRSEYLAHVEGRCPARRCPRLIKYAIGDRCIGCTRCAQSCPVSAIAFTPHRRQIIDETLCIRCGRCVEVCPVGAPEVEDK